MEPTESHELTDFATWRTLIQLVNTWEPRLSDWKASVGRGVIGGFVMTPDDGYLDLMRACEPVQQALRKADRGSVDFAVRIAYDGRVSITLAAESTTHQVVRVPGINSAGTLLLVPDCDPAPARQKPAFFPDVRTAPSADPELLEDVLRERMPGAIGASADELADLEERIGRPLPDELRAVLTVTKADYGTDWALENTETEALGGICLFGLDGIESASTADVRKGLPFDILAGVAAVTTLDSAVQGLIDPPDWLVIGDHGGGSGDWVAVDLAPGPAGHIGQLVIISHEAEIGAELLAESFTDLVVHGNTKDATDDACTEPPAVVSLVAGSEMTIEAAATTALQVLTIGGSDRATDLTPLVGLPGLRTLRAAPGTIAAPHVIGELDHLEYLEIGLAEWETLLEADAVPSSLLAASVYGYGLPRADVDHVYDELIRRWGGNPLTTQTIEGMLTA